MNSKELRIGNLVNRLGEPHFITAIFPDGNIGIDTRKHVFIYEVEPIPLTEEWLLKLGFRDHIININDLEFSLLIKNKLLVIIHNDEPKGLYIDIEFVHELQNIVFALTKKELTLHTS